MHVAFSRPVIAEEAAEATARVLSSGWVTTGPECVAFEDEFASWVGASHAVTVSSCTAAIELSLLALGLPEGSPVLVPAITFCGVVGAVVHARLVPVIVDVDPATAAVSPATCAAAARACGGADAMVVLHFAGYPADVDELATAAGLPLSRVVEDAAHGLGAWVGERPVGTLSRATCFSFYATKNLPIGEGGMVTTEDADLADRVRRGRLHGMSKDAWRRYLPGGSWRYSVEEPGLKANLSDVQAAIGRVQLRRLHEWQRRRAELALRYDRSLCDVPGLGLPVAPSTGKHAWHLYLVRVRPEFGMNRNRLIDALSVRGIATSVHFIPLHHLSYVREVAVIPAGGCPGADTAFGELLSLPLDQGMTDDDVDATCAALLDARSQLSLQEVHR